MNILYAEGLLGNRLQRIEFDKARQTNIPSERRAYVHFYMHDRRFSSIITDAEKHLPLLQQFDGIITPDPTILDGQAACLQQTNTHFNRAVGFFLQKHGVPVIPNIRWGELNPAIPVPRETKRPAT